MNKRGFTFVELLGVIVILCLIFLVATPTVNKVILNSKEKMFDRNIKTILSAANDWAVDNASILPANIDDKINITIGQLKQGGYLNANIKNPKTGKLFNNGMIIQILNIGYSGENKKVKYSRYNGHYMFVVDIDSKDDTDVFDKDSPQIILNGDIVTYVEIGDTYNELGYTAKTSSNKDITEDVTEEIRNRNTVVSDIDTTSLNVYEIYYTILDSDKSTTVTRTVIVRDTVAPEITIPFSNTISLSITEYDLNDGVSCTDNSGNCNIEIEGSIEFGVPGKYVIKYSSTDSTGNKSTKKRVIIIK